MIANKKGIVRRDRPSIKYAEGRFQLRWARGEAKERPHLRILRQRPLAIGEGQRDRILRDERLARRDCARKLIGKLTISMKNRDKKHTGVGAWRNAKFENFSNVGAF